MVCSCHLVQAARVSLHMEKKPAKQGVPSKDFAELDVHLLYVHGSLRPSVCLSIYYDIGKPIFTYPQS